MEDRTKGQKIVGVEVHPRDGGDRDSIYLSKENYPDLENMKKGQNIKGSFTATVDSLDNDGGTVSFDSIEFDLENVADKELAKIVSDRQENMSNEPIEEE